MSRSLRQLWFGGKPVPLPYSSPTTAPPRPRSPKRKLVGGVLLCLAACGVSWFYAQAYFAKGLSDPERARLEGRPIPVRTDHVTESVMEKVVGATAISVPSEIVNIRIGPSRGIT